MKKNISIILILTLLSGCGGTKPKIPKTHLPLSHQATFIESSSSSEVLIHSIGLGSSLQEANLDAGRAAIWFVLYGGDTPILQTLNEKQKFKIIEEKIFKNINQFITYDSGIKSKEKNNNQYKLAHVFKINIALLKDLLIKYKVLHPLDKLMENSELPHIAIINHNKKNKNIAYSVGVISEYLLDRDFDVQKILSQNQDKIFLQIAKNLNADPLATQMYADALSSGSDIYINIKISTSQKNLGPDVIKKASVILSAYYTASNQEIGSTIGYSQERVNSDFTTLVAEASHDAANKLLNQIQKSWKKELQKGKAYKIIITTENTLIKQVRRPIYKMLKQSCSKVIPNKTIENIFDYTLHCKNIENYQDLEIKLSDNYTGPGELSLQNAKGSLLMLNITTPENDNIEIE